MNRIDEIRERCEATTPGPWVFDDTAKELRNKSGKTIAEDSDGFGINIRNDNAEFIAHARDDIPFLLSEIDRLNGDTQQELKMTPGDNYILKCDLHLLNDRILNLGSGLATMPENGTMQVNKAFLVSILGYMEELLGMRHAQTANEPLSLEELRQMDGEWLWVEHMESSASIAVPGEWLKLKTCVPTFAHPYIDFGEKSLCVLYYGEAWLAYRYKPKEANHAEG